MKLRIPGKKNKESQFRSDDTVFDLTGSTAASYADEAVNAASSVAAFGLLSDNDDAFEVNVRNEEPLIRRLKGGDTAIFRMKEIQADAACAAIVMTLLCLLLTAAEATELIPFAAPGLLLFILTAALGHIDRDRVRLYASLAIGAALIAALIVFRGYIASGWALIINQLYDAGELAQAYVYDRFHVGAAGDEHPYRSMHAAVIWGSCLLGFLTAVLPSSSRRPVSICIAAFAMLAFAYYGIIPSWACIAVMAAALLFAMSRGSLLSSLTVLLAGIIVFGAVTLIDPGENYGISRADENFRDRFALISSYLESGDTSIDDLGNMEQQMQDQQNRDNENGGSEFMDEHRWLITAAVIVIILAALGTAAWLYIRRLRRRQAENRAGIDSRDPGKAIVAMFPYAVRWLQPAGIDTAGRPFAALAPLIRSEISGQYADRYTSMYRLWEEAAYSDHEMTEESRNEMNSFLNDTISMIREQSSLRTRIINTVKYAL